MKYSFILLLLLVLIVGGFALRAGRSGSGKSTALYKKKDHSSESTSIGEAAAQGTFLGILVIIFIGTLLAFGA